MYLLMRHSAAFSLVPVPSAGRGSSALQPTVDLPLGLLLPLFSSACSAAFSDVRGLGISSSGISITILRQPRQSQAVLYLLKRLPSWRDIDLRAAGTKETGWASRATTGHCPVPQ